MYAKLLAIQFPHYQLKIHLRQLLHHQIHKLLKGIAGHHFKKHIQFGIQIQLYLGEVFFRLYVC